MNKLQQININFNKNKTNIDLENLNSIYIKYLPLSFINNQLNIKMRNYLKLKFNSRDTNILHINNNLLLI